MAGNTGLVLDRGLSALPAGGDLAEVLAEPASDGPGQRARRLWCAVLQRALIDAKGSGNFGTGADAVFNVRTSRAWLTNGGQHRDWVLLAAGVDPQAFAGTAVKRLVALWAAIDAGGKSKKTRTYHRTTPGTSRSAMYLAAKRRREAA